jgi:hypothetical protein
MARSAMARLRLRPSEVMKTKSTFDRGREKDANNEREEAAGKSWAVVKGEVLTRG